MTKTINLAEFKAQYRARCKELAIDPALGRNEYQMVLFRAEQVEREKYAHWRQSEVAQVFKDWNDPSASAFETQMLRSIGRQVLPDKPSYDDLVDLPLLTELWHEVRDEIRSEVSPRNYERNRDWIEEIQVDLFDFEHMVASLQKKSALRYLQKSGRE